MVAYAGMVSAASAHPLPGAIVVVAPVGYAVGVLAERVIGVPVAVYAGRFVAYVPMRVMLVGGQMP